MPNSLTALGLTTSTRAELVAYLTAQYQAIYGADINLSSDTPDGQMMNIYIQMLLDTQDLVTQVYNQFDPDNAIGVVLDQRVAINGIKRQAGTYSITPITLTISQAIGVLYGADQDIQPVYTVADNAGNQWQLQTTTSIVTVGTHIYTFQAAVPGAQLTIPGTIQVPVTIVLGVAAINNPTAQTVIGINEESDALLKVRRQQSVALSSQGYYAGLLAALENIPGMTSAFIYENDTGTTDADGVPGHSIWVIVAGTAAVASIANAIYTKRNAGCGMFGAVSYTITQLDGSPFIVLWDNVAPVNVFVSFTVTSINNTAAPNIAGITPYLVANYLPTVYEEVDINHLATLVQQADSNTLVTLAGFSRGTTQIATPSGTAASGTFKVAYNGVSSAAINWNDVIGTVQTKVRAITGLSAANVTGSIATTLTFDLSPLSNVLTLITVNTNSLQTGGSVAITFAFNEGATNVLLPASKKNQFVLSAGNILILPMQLNPTLATVTRSTTAQFTGLGGQAALTYTLSVNNSGGSINATTGLYTAGATPNVTDTVKVTDLFGNTATATANVI